MCYLVDRRVWQFGVMVQGEIDAEANKKNGKPQQRLQELLSDSAVVIGKPKKGTLSQLLKMAGPNAKVKRVP